MPPNDVAAKSALNGILPLLTGLVIGLLASLATFAGRISALETTAATHTEALRDIRGDLRAISAKLDHAKSTGGAQ